MTDRSVESTDAGRQASWNTRRLLEWMTRHFTDKRVDSPRLVAEMLLAHVLGCERMRLYMEVDRPASSGELDRLRPLVVRAGRHEPVQYLVGEAWFYGMRLAVNRSTLIPRPSTETLVQHVVEHCRTLVPSSRDESQVVSPAELTEAPEPAGLRLADLGTGTGCIAISLARQIPEARVVATDVVAEALELARVNARRHHVADRIDFRLGSLFVPLPAPADGDCRFDVICCNPPYIPDHEWNDVDRNVRCHEPATALRGGPEGLDVIEPLIAGAGRWLTSGGQLVVEIAHCQRNAVIDLVARTCDLAEPRVLKDHEGFWRVLVADAIGGG
ncbi:MAG: peptide chain release factor N(5)-glutamine methyltransferase [Phycisphaerales bacterium]|nr:MAG: peptide chain release factor N(5)-glutamine methyltransferase [Phycisphaerales bacterium]